MIFVQLVFFLSFPSIHIIYFIRENWFLFYWSFIVETSTRNQTTLNTMRIVLILTIFLTLISFIDFVLVTPIVGGYAPNNCGRRKIRTFWERERESVGRDINLNNENIIFSRSIQIFCVIALPKLDEWHN